MVDVRVSAASGTAADWQQSSLIMGVGQLVWETDTGILRIGDGTNTAVNLPVLASLQTSSLQIADNAATSDTVWSGQQTQAAIAQALSDAAAYTDQATSTSGGLPRLDVSYQNTDGTWDARPHAYAVFAFGTTAPSWLTTNIDTFFYRS